MPITKGNHCAYDTHYHLVFPLKKDLWGGEFWSDGYYAATVSTGGNWAVVEKYVKNQGKNPNDLQLTVW